MSNADKIAELRAEADRLEAADREFKALLPEHQLAISLHSLLCHHNHVDGCGWEYEGYSGHTDWGGHAHGRYLGKARRILIQCSDHNISADVALEIIKMAGE